VLTTEAVYSEEKRAEVTMNKRTISRILASTTFCTAVMFAANTVGQTAAHPTSPGNTQQVTPKGATSTTNTKAAQNAAHSNPACQQIVNECKNLGYIVGEWKTDNGVWRDCFDPVVNGGAPTREGRPVHVPVSSSVIQECRAAREHHQQTQTTHTGTTGGTKGMPKQ
jgi:hypothetical protein